MDLQDVPPFYPLIPFVLAVLYPLKDDLHFQERQEQRVLLHQAELIFLGDCLAAFLEGSAFFFDGVDCAFTANVPNARNKLAKTNFFMILKKFNWLLISKTSILLMILYQILYFN